MNDVIALLAMDFLTRRGVAIPGRISVCGFDDSLDALGRGLTSYNYNVPAVVRAMMDHILRPSGGTAKMRDFPSEIDGTVMERRSSGATNR